MAFLRFAYPFHLAHSRLRKIGIVKRM